MAAVAAMLVLGVAVGHGSTAVDDGFAATLSAVIGPQPRWLLVFTDLRLIAAISLGCLAACLYRRRWSLAVAVVGCPLLISVVTAGLKRTFDRRNGPYLEYPSGHTALLVAVLGMLVLVAAARAWAWAAALIVGVCGAAGLIGCGYHYLTDTIGAAMLAGAVVGGAARLTSWR